jgi:type I restriction enzyme, S subunit
MSNQEKKKSAKTAAQATVLPKLRFPEFREAEGWQKTFLGEVAKLRNGYAFKSSDYVDSGLFQIITIANVQQGELTLDSTKKIAKLPADIQAHQQLRFKDILISMTGNVGRVCRVTREALLLNQRVGKLVPESIDADFFYHLLQRDEFRNAMQLKAAGGAQGNLSSVAITEYALQYPSEKAEQQKIAECLSSVDELIAAQARKVDALKTQKKGLMQQLFPREGEAQPRLRFPEFQNAEEWKRKPLGSLCMRIMDGTHFSPKSKDGPRPYLTSKNIRVGRIDLSNLSYISEEEHAEIYSKCPVKPLDVLLTKDGANTGNCALNSLDFEFSLLSSVAVLRGNPEKLCQEFLFQSIISDSVQSLISESMSGQAITRITLAKIGGFTIPVASLDEQQRIASCLSTLDTLITAAIQKLDALKLHKRGLMQQLFPNVEEVKE